MSMHTPEEWNHHATLNMTQAQQQQYRALAQCDSSRRAHNDTVNSNLSMYDSVHRSMSQKVKNSYRMIEKLQKRAQSLEASIASSKNSMAMLEKALRAKDAPLQLCTWRLEQREKRPLREQVRDNVEIALEEEKATLMEAQRRLVEGMKKTKGMLDALEEALHDVRQDIEHKMQALSVDEMCLRSTERSMHAVVERTPPPSSHRSTPRSPGSSRSARHQVALAETSRNEVNRQQEAERLNRSALAREEAAKALREESAKLASRCDHAAHDAQDKTEKRMQERVHENQTMRRRLEGELRETMDKIEHTKATMSQTRHHMKALEEPMDLTATCSSWRKQRVNKEHINDPVSTALHEHRMTVLSAHQDLLSQHQNEKTNLKELNERRERLKEDLRDKTASLHIDLNCLTHEAIQLNGKNWAGVSKQKLARSMKVDRGFIPGAVPVSAR